MFADENGKLYEDSIYIFCADTVKHGQWAIEYLDFDCIKMEKGDQAILARLIHEISPNILSNKENIFKR